MTTAQLQFYVTLASTSLVLDGKKVDDFNEETLESYIYKFRIGAANCAETFTVKKLMMEAQLTLVRGGSNSSHTAERLFQAAIKEAKRYNQIHDEGS